MSTTENTNEISNIEEDVISFDLAGLNSRAAAFIIDVVIISIIALLAFGIGVFFVKDPEISLGNVFMPIFLLLFFLSSSYFVILNGYSGKTIGKMIVGIKIISDDGDGIGFWQSFVRWIGYYISAIFLFLGFIWSIFDQNSQSWHDKIAGTYVVKE
ncbi:MAG: RDD family protein [Thermodesulfobacteriota bacterium]